MAIVRDIYQYLDKMAPFSIQESFDNAGFLVGWEDAPVKKILVALDVTEDVIREAVERNCSLLVTHHPVIFHPVKSLTADDPVGRRLLMLVENRIAAICAHTNLDAVAGGVNDALAERLGLTQVEQLHQNGVDEKGRPYGIGRIGIVPPYKHLEDFAVFVRDRLQAKGLRFTNVGKPVHRVAVGGGACGDMLADAAALGCDTFVTADVKYNVFLDAKEMGVNLLDAGHFATENVVCPVLASWLRKGFPNLEILSSERHKEIFCALPPVK